jgi:hypothetical protein
LNCATIKNSPEGRTGNVFIAFMHYPRSEIDRRDACICKNAGLELTIVVLFDQQQSKKGNLPL